TDLKSRIVDKKFFIFKMTNIEDSNTKQNVSSSNSSSLYSNTTLFVRRIPYDATNSDFEAFFSEIGPLRSCFLVKDKEETLINDNDSIVPPLSHSKEMVATREIIHSIKDTEKYL